MAAVKSTIYPTDITFASFRATLQTLRSILQQHTMQCRNKATCSIWVCFLIHVSESKKPAENSGGHLPSPQAGLLSKWRRTVQTALKRMERMAERQRREAQRENFGALTRASGAPYYLIEYLNLLKIPLIETKWLPFGLFSAVRAHEQRAADVLCSEKAHCTSRYMPGTHRENFRDGHFFALQGPQYLEYFRRSFLPLQRRGLKNTPM